jgi:XTP/dITP diphosphohydrolase
MPRLLLATSNPHKLREIRGLLAETPVELLSLADVPAVPEPEETGSTFEQNARLKASGYDELVRESWPEAQRNPFLTVAEDSGLIVDALGGEPGIYSARFLRPDATYPERFAELYRRLEASKATPPWTARFVCAVAVVNHGKTVFEAQGVVEGLIHDQPAGNAGFGYDPIFFFPEYGTTFAEVSDEQKLRVAHRGHAFRSLVRWLSEPHPY